MSGSFSKKEWRKIHEHFDKYANQHGLPIRRKNSFVIGSFNIRKLGKKDSKSDGSWEMLAKISRRFDLLAIQEVQDNMDGLKKLRGMLGRKYGMVASDITGRPPGGRSLAERLAFLFRWDRVERTEIASDISYDRSSVIDTLLREWDGIQRAINAKLAGNARYVRLPTFLTFIRQPSCVTFRIKGADGAKPYEFMAINAHLLYGRYAAERYMEFQALIKWLEYRAATEHSYCRDMLLLGDLNLDFNNPNTDRKNIDKDLKSINAKLSRKRGDIATMYFPFLDKHPKRSDVFRSNARLNQTYDQIAIVARDKRLPAPKIKDSAGKTRDGFDYGVFNFVDLFSQALHKKPFKDLGKAQQKTLLDKFEHDLSDHMPIWVRLPKPKP